MQHSLDREQQVRQELQQARQVRLHQAERWQAFMQRGPLKVTVFPCQTPEPGEGVRIDLSAQEFAILFLPVRRAQLSECLHMVESERAELSRQLDGHKETIER